MEFTELDLGAKCHHCKQHDYLPFLCQNCGEHFCQKHFHVDSHNCNCVERSEAKLNDLSDVEPAGVNPLASSASCSKKPKLVKKKKNKLPKCKKKGCRRRDMIPFTCKYCKKSFCSSHRLPKHHDCPAHLARIAGQELREKHAAMLISDEAKKLAKLIQEIRT